MEAKCDKLAAEVSWQGLT